MTTFTLADTKHLEIGRLGGKINSICSLQAVDGGKEGAWRSNGKQSATEAPRKLGEGAGTG